MATRTKGRIDINNATADEIERACGIDGVLAERIVRYRGEHGPFATREDLDAVPGFAKVRTDEVLSVVDLPSQRTSRRTSRDEDRSRSGERTGPTRSRARTSDPARRGSSSSRSGESTTDHDFIRQWVEQRGGWPASVRGTGRQGDIGMIRIDFPGFTGEDSLERITWDQWFEQFDDNQLAFLHRDMRHDDGQLDRFNKLVKRERSGG